MLIGRGSLDLRLPRGSGDGTESLNVFCRRAGSRREGRHTLALAPIVGGWTQGVLATSVVSTGLIMTTGAKESFRGTASGVSTPLG